MHESRLVADLIGEAIRVAGLNGSQDVREVSVDIGALSHVTTASLESHLKEAARDSVVENATVTITKSEDTSAVDALDIRLVSMKIGDG